jgi:hypothetical protein
MAKKYVDLSKGRLAVIEYFWKANEESELFKELDEDDVIPEELWHKNPHNMSIEFIRRENGSESNVYDAWDSKSIFDAIDSLKPPKGLTVMDYYS